MDLMMVVRYIPGLAFFLYSFAGFIEPSLAESEGGWRGTCSNGICSISKFVADSRDPNLAIGLIFSSPESSLDKTDIKLRLIAPLGSDLSHGIFVDLDDLEIGKRDFVACPDIGCFADVSLEGLRVYSFLAAEKIGVTIWDQDLTPYRVQISTDGLRRYLRKMIMDEKVKSDVIVSYGASPSLRGVATMAYGNARDGACSSILSSDVSFEIADTQIIAAYIAANNIKVENELKRLNSEFDKFSYIKSKSFPVDFQNIIEKTALDYAASVDIDSVSFPNKGFDIVKKGIRDKCILNGVELVGNQNGDVAQIWSFAGHGTVSSANWIAGVRIVDQEGGNKFANQDAADYALRLFSSKVIERTLAEKYGLKSLPAE